MADDSRRALVLGIGIALLGLICLGGGIALLVWRIASPDEAVIVPSNLISTPESTPTPGVLSVPLALPPLPENAAAVAFLPISEPPTPPPTPPVDPTSTETPSTTPSPIPSASPSASPTPSISPPASPTQSAIPAPTKMRPSPTFTAAASSTPTQFPPSPTPTATASPPPSLTPSPVPTRPPSIPDRIIIEKIGLDAPVVPVGQHPIQLGDQVYSQWNVPNEFAAGWHQLSAPLGERGNTVLNGHHNIYGEVFRYLVRLEPGDIITLASGDQRFTYVVAQTMTLAESGQPANVRETNARWILPTADERVTLITCWPYAANTHRLVVIALSVATLDHLSGIP